MTIAQAILDILPATIEAISGYSSVVPSLKGWYEQFPNVLSFINAGVKAAGQGARGVFGEAWRVYSYFRNQGTYLNQVDANVVIDPRLAINAPIPVLQMPGQGQYRYGMQYSVWIPDMSMWKQFNLWVFSPSPLTPEGASIRGLRTLNTYLEKYRVQLEEDTLNQPDELRGISITSFTRFIPE